MGFNWKRAAGLPPMDSSWGAQPTRERIMRLENYTVIEPRAVHMNPRFFKYRWRIWALDNTDEDWTPQRDDRISPTAFSTWLGHDSRPQPVPDLTFPEAIRRMQALVANRAYFYALMERLRRYDPAAPWELNTCRASAYDEDPDEAFHGYK